MKIIDGTGAPLGRLSSYVAKSALKGEEVKILNCDKVIITGNFETTKKNFEEKRSRVGSSQKGPKHSATSEKIVKRAIKGMLPNPRGGRGRIALKKIMCFSGVPKEYENSKDIENLSKKKSKFSEVKKFTK